MNESIKIFNELKDILNLAYTPFSNYKVACILLTNKGRFIGVNVEPDVINLGICAERNAIFSAVSQIGGDFKISHLFLLTTSKNNFGMPCGACRQIISQFSNENTKITSFMLDGSQAEYKLYDLLPEMWSKKDLL